MHGKHLKNGKHIYLALALVFVLVSVFIIEFGKEDYLNAPEIFQQAAIGSKAPNFELYSLDGTKSELSQYKEKPVILNFWASWCLPCKEEMPLLQRLQDENPQITVIGINLQESPEIIRSYLSDLNITFTVLLDPDKKAKELYNVYAQPTTFFIGKNMMIMEKHIGKLAEQKMLYYLPKMTQKQ